MDRSIWRRALGALIVLTAVGASTLVAPPGAAAQVPSPIADLEACRASTLPANDDGSVTDPVPLGFTANFLGAASVQWDIGDADEGPTSVPVNALEPGEERDIGDVTVTGPTPPPAGVVVNGAAPGTIPSVVVGRPFPVVIDPPDECAAATEVTYTITAESGASVTGTLAFEPATGTFSGDITVPFTGPATVVVELTGCPNVTFSIYIDPSGFVRTTDGDPIAGAEVTLLFSASADGPFAPLPDGDTRMSPANRTNPDVTDATGHFGWDVVAGFYQVQASAAGCENPDDGSPAVLSEVFAIPPPVTDVDLRLACDSAEDLVANQRFVTAVYRQVLNRDVDEEGLNFWTGVVEDGAPRAQVVAAIISSPEGRAVACFSLYLMWPDQVINAAQTAHCSALLAGGQRYADVAALLTQSPEFLAQTDGTTSGFLSLTYVRGVGRLPDPGGEAFWLGRLAAGESRLEVARAIITSVEGLTQVLEPIYIVALGRGADDGGRAFWVGLLQAGQTEATVIAAILGSEEFYARAAVGAASVESVVEAAVPGN